MFALALGNHSLVLLFAPGIGLFVVRGGAGHPPSQAPGRDVPRGLLGLTLVAVFLELPLRAGPFRAPLVYGHPETWDGVLVHRPRPSSSRAASSTPSGTSARSSATLVRLATDQLGPLVVLVPFGFVVTAIRRPRYALLTATTLALTCWFAGSYDNAEIERYYLVPLLIVVTWLAVLVGAACEGLERRFAPARLDRHGARAGIPVVGFALAVLLVFPTVGALPERWRTVDQSRLTDAQDWLDVVLDERLTGPEAVIVSWWSYSTPLWYAQRIEGRRPDIRIVDDRTRLDEDLGEIEDVIDANLGRHPVIVIQVDPEVIARLAARYRLAPLPVPGDQPVYRVDGILVATPGSTGSTR